MVPTRLLEKFRSLKCSLYLFFSISNLRQPMCFPLSFISLLTLSFGVGRIVADCNCCEIDFATLSTTQFPVSREGLLRQFASLMYSGILKRSAEIQRKARQWCSGAGGTPKPSHHCKKKSRFASGFCGLIFYYSRAKLTDTFAVTLISPIATVSLGAPPPPTPSASAFMA